jgi:hypothetical protein
MLLKQLLQRPRVAPNLLFRNPFMEEGPEQLVKEIIGLANADVDGPRYIVFGINLASMQGSGIVGLSESAMANLKKARRAVSTLIEPVVGLAFIYDKIEGRLVGSPRDRRLRRCPLHRAAGGEIAQGGPILDHRE